MRFKRFDNAVQITLSTDEKNILKEVLSDVKVGFGDVKKIEFLQQLDWKI